MKNQNHSTRKHSPFAASAAHRWLVCPASVSLSKRVPPSPDNPASLAGTKSHEKLEKAFTHKHARKGVMPKLNEDETRALNTLLYLAQSYSEHLIEERLELTTLHPEAFGTVDYAFVSPFEEICIIDYKTGRHVVTPRAEDGGPNPQLAYYAAALAERYDWAFERARLVIVQPPAHSDKDKPCFFEAVFSKQELLDFLKRASVAVLEACEDKPAAVVTEEGCKFCPAKEICPAQQEEGATLEQRGAKALEILAETNPAKLHLLSSRELGALKDACELLPNYLASIEAKLLELAAAGKDVTGYRYQAKQARRKWLDVEEAAKQARKLFGKSAFEESLKGIPALEKLDKDFVAEYTTKESSGFVLKKIGARDNAEFFSAL